MKIVLAAVLAFGLLGCGGTNKVVNGETGGVEGGGESLTSCTGFISPSANIFVKSAIDQTIIGNATVIINSIGESATLTEEAVYVEGDDMLENSEDYAYFTILEMNESSWTLNYTVSAPGYDTVTSEDYLFVLNTSCGASNDFTEEVFLCPTGTTCE